MTWAERWATIERFLPQLWDGTLVTLQLVGLAVLIGLFFAIPLGVARASRHWYIRALPYSYIFFFRGTPLLLQLCYLRLAPAAPAPAHTQRRTDACATPAVRRRGLHASAPAAAPQSAPPTA